jgi:hypothetical protein
VKGFALYVAVLGALSGFIFRTGTAYEDKLALLTAEVIGSLAALFGTIVSRRWVIDLEATMTKITSDLGLAPFPFSGAKNIALVAMVVVILFTLGGALVLYLYLKTPCAYAF